ncbi:MAG: KTSC domain-containing protein [Bacteroidota bacterium]|jgi:curved DNA-binding protein CbpA|uniref:KTSC domain-containing protein n=1 Tax=Pedobacter cryotolerans TaxID=2571270 RepID=A0A4U1CB79_9SPHI|nr:KTSC domain-containing protein [Pedobacter cryotolerans]RZJ80966.1 MAG: KTSC domain-containing protein [Flavobacterium sp.]TKC03296.1 KTSC domain-containing protein [Pedobacter cryotolerans]
MKKVGDYRKTLGVTKATELKEIKTIYRGLMKDWHPDKFSADADKHAEAEEKSKEIIEAYNFLLSIAPETLEHAKDEYIQTTTLSNIQDFQFKDAILRIDFFDGSAYEYFDVPRAMYIKLVNADSPGRFARRHIFNAFPYRNVAKLAMA